MKQRSRLVGFTLLAVASACSDGANEPEARPPDARELTAGVVASAGRQLIAAETVARVAQRQGVAPARALEHALSDALLAEGARDALSPATLTTIERAAQARRLLEALAAEAAVSAPPTQAELDELLRERWVDLDRPAAARTVHAVVLNKDSAREPAARALAEKLAEAVHSALSAAEFITQAKAVPTDGFEVIAEELPFITADGRSFQARDSTFVARPSGFDRTFAEAANALETEGQQSPIVKTPFGFHVIRLEARQPAAGIPEAERAAALAPEVSLRRVARARKELLDGLRKSNVIQVDRAVDELTSRLQKSQ